MSKPLTERVLARLKVRSKKSYAHNRASFLALSGEIKEALSEGLSLKAIWETLHDEGKINFKYDTFLRYAKKYLDEQTRTEHKEKPAKTHRNKLSNIESVVRASPDKETKSTPDTQTFIFNPNRTLEDFT